MQKYARIQDSRVAELLETDGDIISMFNPALLWVDVSSEPTVDHGWSFDGMNFIPPPVSAPNEAAPTIAELQVQIAAIAARLTVLSQQD
jgi:hypothetical protein